MNFILWLATGILIGWIASKFYGRDRSLMGYLSVGIMGSYFGGFVFHLLDIEFGGYFGSLITSIIGAVLLIFVFKTLRERREARRK